MSPRAAQVRCYVDADILGLGKILGGLRNDITYPGDHGTVIHKRHRAPCPIATPDVLDTDWIPEVAARGWLIVTRDSMIIQNRNEIAAIRENNAKMVALNQRDAHSRPGAGRTGGKVQRDYRNAGSRASPTRRGSIRSDSSAEMRAWKRRVQLGYGAAIRA